NVSSPSPRVCHMREGSCRPAADLPFRAHSTMTIARAVNLEDVRKLAKRRLPKIAYDYIEGGVDDETCLDRNREAFDRYMLVPRYLVDVMKRDQSVSLFGRSYAS